MTHPSLCTHSPPFILPSLLLLRWSFSLLSARWQVLKSSACITIHGLLVLTLTAHTCHVVLAASLVWCSPMCRIPLYHAQDVKQDMRQWLILTYSCLPTHACILMLAYSCLHTHACILMFAYSCLLTHCPCTTSW